MPEWLIGFGLCIGAWLVQDLLVVGVLWIVHRVWGEKGLARVLGMTRDERARSTRSRTSQRGSKV